MQWILIHMGETRRAYKILVEIYKENGQPEALRSVKQNKIKCDVSKGLSGREPE
jgi:hypothetical protein